MGGTTIKNNGSTRLMNTISVAFVCSNAQPIRATTHKGTEIFVHILLEYLTRSETDITITAFASSDSILPVPVVSLGFPATSIDPTIPDEKKVIFELALIARAFSMQSEYDLYHIHIGDGDLILPFAQYVKKPIIITIHHLYDLPYITRYFPLFKDFRNVYFVAASEAQKKLIPDLAYAGTIHHGIETEEFAYDKNGGDSLLWAGRGVPTKALDHAIDIARSTKKILNACVIRKKESIEWLETTVYKAHDLTLRRQLSITYDVDREKLIHEYQHSKALLFTTLAEEIFGLVLIEAMACGTPIIAYAKGAVPEVVVDGVTGFLINPSEDDIRGNFCIKETGIEGMKKAVERLYNMSTSDYAFMRKACRTHVEHHFTAKRMAEDYARLYKEIVNRK